MENSGIEIDYTVLQRPQFFLFLVCSSNFLFYFNKNLLISNCLHLLI